MKKMILTVIALAFAIGMAASVSWGSEPESATWESATWESATWETLDAVGEVFE